MKNKKIIMPAILMMLLCVAVLCIGIYAARPVTNTITGVIKINAAKIEINVAVYGVDANGNISEEPIFASASTKEITEIALGEITFDLSNIITDADLHKAKMKFIFRLENPTEQDLGIYFSTNGATYAASASDILETAPLTAELEEGAGTTNELIQANFPNIYSKLEGKDAEGNNGTCDIPMEFALISIPNESYFVNLEDAANKIYFNVENYNGDIIDPAFEANNYTIVGTKDEPLTASAYQNNKDLTKVKIAEGVNGVGNYAFDGCSSLTNVAMPNSVESIGTYAFRNCSSLTTTAIPEKVAIINDYAFQNCSSLTTITIPEEVTSIGRCAFDGCSGLNSITFPDSVISIGAYAFNGCGGLKNLTIPDSVTSISSYTFNGCSGLESIVVGANNQKYDSRDNCNAIIDSSNNLILGCKNTVIPDSVTSISSYAFNGCSGLKSIIIPDSVNNIGTNAFDGCSGMKSITLSNTLTTIGTAAFNDCRSLISITIPASVTSISATAVMGKSLFSNCTSLESIVVADGNQKYDSRNNCNAIITSANVLIAGCKNTVIPGGANGVVKIDGSAFNGCSELKSITIPDSVTTIASAAFTGCVGLGTIVVANGNQKYDSRDNCNAIIDSSNNLILGCKNTVIPDSVTRIYSSAFEVVVGLKALTIPDSVNTIDSKAFSGCINLEYIWIPASVTTVGASSALSTPPFNNCPNLTIYFQTADTSKPTNWKDTWGDSIKNVVWGASYNDYLAAIENI